MRTRVLAIAASSMLFAAAAAWASFGGGGAKDDAPKSSTVPTSWRSQAPLDAIAPKHPVQPASSRNALPVLVGVVPDGR